MKGFVITPVLFVALFLIAGIMLITFMTLDKRIASGIALESAVRKAQFDLLENETAAETLLFYASIGAASAVSTEAELKAAIESRISPVSLAFDPAAQPAWFAANHSYAFSRAGDSFSLERIVNAETLISCDAITEFYPQDISILLGDGRWFNCTA